MLDLGTNKSRCSPTPCHERAAETSRRVLKYGALCGIVSIDLDVPSSDLHTDKLLIESDTEALSEINDGICAVGSDSGHENRSSLPS